MTSPAYDVSQSYYSPYWYDDDRKAPNGCTYHNRLTGSAISAVTRVAKSATISTRPWVPYTLVPPTPYQRRIVRADVLGLRWSGTAKNGPFDYCKGSYVQWAQTLSGTYGFSSAPTTLLGDLVYTPSVRTKTEIKVLNAIKDESSANLGLMFLERKETEDLFVDTMRKIFRSVVNIRNAVGHRRWQHLLDTYDRHGMYQTRTYVRRGKFFKNHPAPITLSRRETLGLKLPEWWLEVQYGWSPLLQDVYDAMRVVDFHQQNRHFYFSKEGKVSVPNRVTRSASATPYTGGVVDFDCMQHERGKIRLDYRLQSDVLQPLATLGLTNPLSLIWERVPFSFVVDWAIPLGNWFNTFDATLGKAFVHGCYTGTIRENSTSVRFRDTGTSNFTLSGDASMCRFSRLQMDRVVLDYFPSPSAPAFKNPCSPTHVANALSLLVTAFGRGVPRSAIR